MAEEAAGVEAPGVDGNTPADEGFDFGSDQTQQVSGPSPGGPKPSAGPATDEPRAIGRFVVLRRLGAGGMGVVYAAFDETLDRKLAVKLLRTDASARDTASSSSEGRARLVREAQALARLSHPNVIHVYEVGTHEQQVYVAMEFVDGLTLKRWQNEPDRTPREILEVYAAAAHGLAAAHRAGIVHRDFKPDNVLVGAQDERPRVLDFGLARESGRSVEALAAELEATEGEVPPSQQQTTSSARFSASKSLELGLKGELTQTGAVLGTPAYMAPEQFRGEPSDARTDQFAYCVSLYEALYGERPFRGSTLTALMHSVCEGLVEPEPQYTQVSPQLRRVLLKGLSVSPAERYESMDELLDALRVETPKPWRWIALAAVAVTLLAVSGWLFVRSQAEPYDDLDSRRRINDAFVRADAVQAAQAQRAGTDQEVNLHWDRLVLAWARQEVERDPTRALAALRGLTPSTGETWGEQARMVAEQALDAGVAYDVVRRPGVVALAATDDAFAISDATGLWRWGTDGSFMRLGDAGVLALASSQRPETRWLAVRPGTAQWLDQKGNVVHAVAIPETCDASAAASQGTSAWISCRSGTLMRVDDGSGTEFDTLDEVIDILVRGEEVYIADDAGAVSVFQGDAFADLARVRGRPSLMSGKDGSVLIGAAQGSLGARVAGSERETFELGLSEAAARLGSIVDLRAGDLEGSVAVGTGGAGRNVGVVVDSRMRTLGILPGHDEPIRLAEVSGDGEWIVTVAGTADARMWRVPSPNPEVLGGHDAVVSARALTPDGAGLVTGSRNGALRRWDTSTGIGATFGQHASALEWLAHSPDGVFLATAAGGPARLWRSKDAKVVHTVLDGAETSALAWRDSEDAEQQLLAVAGCGHEGGCRVEVVSREGVEIARLELSDNRRSSARPERVAWFGDGEHLAVLCAERSHVCSLSEDRKRRCRQVKFDDPMPGAVIAGVSTEDGVRALAFDGERMELVQIDAGSGKARRLLQRTESNVLVHGEWVGIQDSAGMVRLWNLRTDDVISLGAFDTPLLDFAHSPNGDRVALSLKGQALIMDVESGARRQLVSPLRLPVWGKTLLDAPEDGTVRIFRERTPASPRAFFEAIDRLTRVRVGADELR